MEKIFGDYLKKLREDKDLLPIDVAAKIDEKEKNIIKWEDEREYPSLEQVYKLAEFYSVLPDEMLRLREHAQKNNAKLSVFFANLVGRTYQVLSKLPVIMIVGMAIVAFILLNEALQKMVRTLTTNFQLPF